MLTGEIKNKVDKIWESFWTGGITNPLDVIEQFTYLMYMKQLDEEEMKHEADTELFGMDYEGLFPKDKPYLRWHNFKNIGSADEMYEIMTNELFPFIKNLKGDGESSYARFMKDAIFKIPTANLLQKVVTGIEGLNTEEADIKGDLYEHLLSKLNNSGTNGQFRTPRHIINMMVKLIKPVPTDIICDPAMGTAGFLIGAEKYIRKTYPDLFFDADLKDHFNNKMFNGFDMDSTMLRIGAMNLISHHVDNPQIEYRDSLSQNNYDENKYSLILANPPFKGSLDSDVVSESLLSVCKTKKTELLFIALFLRSLKIGGRCACIVPDGVLFGSSKAHKSIRKELIENNQLHAVISMPSGVFKPYAGVSTAILVFTKTTTGGTDKVWFYDMKADGYSLDDKRSKVEENDIPDIIHRYEHLDEEVDRKRTEQSFFVPKEEIVENDYDLSINKYKEIVYEKIEYRPTKEILSDIEKLNKEIDESIRELQSLLKD